MSLGPPLIRLAASRRRDELVEALRNAANMETRAKCFCRDPSLRVRDELARATTTLEKNHKGTLDDFVQSSIGQNKRGH